MAESPPRFLSWGAAKQVRAAAERRLATLANPALRTYERAMNRRAKDYEPALAVSVARDVLNRLGIGAKFVDKSSAGLLPGLNVSELPPGTSVTAAVRVERLTDDELQTMKRLLEKMG